MIGSSMILRRVVILLLIIRSDTFSGHGTSFIRETFRRKSSHLKSLAVITTENKIACLGVCSSSVWCSGGTFHAHSKTCELYQRNVNPNGVLEEIYVRLSAGAFDKGPEVCSSPARALGVGDPAIFPDSAFRASSEYTRPWVAAQGRICWKCRGWCTALGHKAEPGKEWWQVDLGQPHVIQQIAIKGLLSALHHYWIERFSLAYSEDGITWTRYSTDGVKKIFDGNVDATTTAKVPLLVAIETRFLRVWVESFKQINPTGETVCARFELYGCPVSSW